MASYETNIVQEITPSELGASTVRPINSLDLFKTDNFLVSQYWKMNVELFCDSPCT